MTTDTTQSPAANGSARLRPKLRLWIWASVGLIVIVGLSSCTALGTTKRYEIRQISMEPTLHEGDAVVVSGLGRQADLLLANGMHALTALGLPPALDPDGAPITPRFGPKRGQLVVVTPPKFDSAFVERVVGLPGETVEIREGNVWINGQILEEPEIAGVLTERCDRFCDVTLSSNQYFLLGDNRAHSADSRSYGPVTVSAIVGTVVMRYWPLDQVVGFP